MSLVTGRGGVPRVRLLSASSTTGVETDFQDSQFLQIKVGTAACKVYFTQEDFTADTNYITIGTSDPVRELPAEVNHLWFKGSGGTSAVELIIYHRRG